MSSHPNHTKRSIVYSQALTVNMICSRECDFQKHISEMKTWFLRRSYPKNLALKRVPLIARRMKKFKKCFVQDLLFHFKVPVKLVVIL